jgi:hypothetical protein
MYLEFGVLVVLWLELNEQGVEWRDAKADVALFYRA